MQWRAEQRELDALLRWTLGSSLLVIVAKTVAGVVVARLSNAPVTWEFLWGVFPVVRVGVTGSSFVRVVTSSTVVVVTAAVIWSQLGLVASLFRKSWGLSWGTFLAVPMSALLILFELFRFPDLGLELTWLLRLVVLGGLAAATFTFFHPPSVSESNTPR